MTDQDDLSRTVQEAFAVESDEILDRVSQALILAEQAEGDAQQATARRAIKRDLHTLKGAAASVGRTTLRTLCHAQEDVLAAIDRAGGALTAVHFDLLHAAHRAMQGISAADPADDALEKAGALIERLCVAAGMPSDVPVELLPAGGTKAAPERTSQLAQPLAPPEPVDPESERQATDAAGRPADDHTRAQSESIRVAAVKLDQMQSQVGELVVVRLQQAESQAGVAGVSRRVTALQADWRVLSGMIRELRHLVPDAPWRKLDTRMLAFGGRLKETHHDAFHHSTALSNHVAQLGLVSDALEDGLKNIRMLPVGPFLKGFASVVRDASRAVGVTTHLEVTGGNIEVDRLVLERLRDPILHMLRNAVAHGIESAEVRQRRGKNPAGRIRLDAALDGDQVTILVHDDGGGIDPSVVRKHAIRLGLATADEHLSNDRVLEILCHPGLSTASGISELAGRGVGLDVALQAIRGLRGTLELESLEALGTRFRIRVPSSVSTTRGLIVKSGVFSFGIPLDSVERILRVKAKMIAQLEGADIVSVGGEPVTITALGEVLGSQQYARLTGDRALPVLVLRTGGDRLAVIVDDIVGEIPMVVKPLGNQFKRVPQFSGGAIQSDGSVLPTLDPRQLIRGATGRSFNVASAAAPLGASWQVDDRSEGTGGKTVLVVDDSITTRTMERNILEAAGYRVVVATDGEEALEILRMKEGVDLLVTDLQMPRMDGVALCTHVRGEVSASLPIIMVTSIGDESEQRRGVEAGADAYIVKGNFHQDHFLATIRRLTG